MKDLKKNQTPIPRLRAIIDKEATEPDFQTHQFPEECR